jgi:hypothetical protein
VLPQLSQVKYSMAQAKTFYDGCRATFGTGMRAALVGQQAWLAYLETAGNTCLTKSLLGRESFVRDIFFYKIKNFDFEDNEVAFGVCTGSFWCVALI